MADPLIAEGFVISVRFDIGIHKIRVAILEPWGVYVMFLIFQKLILAG